MTLFFIGIILYVLLNINNDKKLVNQLENSLKLTKNLLEEEKRYALSLSILISEDKEFLEAYTRGNREATFNIVNQKIDTLKKLQNSSFEVQVHNQDLHTFIRSWDFSIKDIPLSSFRQGLVKVKATQKPLVSIELGKRLNIKAISPLIKNNQFIGSLEVIIGFEHLENELKQRGLDTYILLHNQYLNIANTLNKNQKNKEYTLVNDMSKNVDFLKDINMNEFKDYGYFTNDDWAFSYFTYYSLKREKLGYLLISSQNSSHLKINNAFENKIINSNTRIIIE